MREHGRHFSNYAKMVTKSKRSFEALPELYSKSIHVQETNFTQTSKKVI